MRRDIDIFHTKTIEDGNPYAFMPHEALIASGINLPNALQVADNYAHVASFWLESDESDLELAERIFKEINTRTGCFQHIISQDRIRDNKTHTSTSVGDIISIDLKRYYVDAVGFKKID